MKSFKKTRIYAEEYYLIKKSETIAILKENSNVMEQKEIVNRFKTGKSRCSKSKVSGILGRMSVEGVIQKKRSLKGRTNTITLISEDKEKQND